MSPRVVLHNHSLGLTQKRPAAYTSGGWVLPRPWPAPRPQGRPPCLQRAVFSPGPPPIFLCVQTPLSTRTVGPGRGSTRLQWAHRFQIRYHSEGLRSRPQHADGRYTVQPITDSRFVHQLWVMGFLSAGHGAGNLTGPVPAQHGTCLPRFLWLRSGASPLLSLVPCHPEAPQKRQLEGHQGIHSPRPHPAGAREQGWAAAWGPPPALSGPRVRFPPLEPCSAPERVSETGQGPGTWGRARRPSQEA